MSGLLITVIYVLLVWASLEALMYTERHNQRHNRRAPVLDGRRASVLILLSVLLIPAWILVAVYWWADKEYDNGGGWRND